MGPKRKLEPDRNKSSHTKKSKKLKSNKSKSNQSNGLNEAEQLKQLAKQDVDNQHGSSWRLSNPMGGRLSHIDPLLSADETHLILAYPTAIQVYTTADSHLFRSIQGLVLDPKHNKLVASYLSPTDPRIVWLLSKNGYIHKLNWFTGEGTKPWGRTNSCRGADMVVREMSVDDKPRDFLFVAEGGIVAYDTKYKDHSEVVLEAPPPDAGDGIRLLRLVPGTATLVAVAGEKKVIVGTPTADEDGKVPNDLPFTFYSFHSTDHVCCLDVYSPPRIDSASLTNGTLRAPPRGTHAPTIDLVLGGARGAIFLYRDLLNDLSKAAKSRRGSAPPFSRLHWHRKAVHSVKWSQDGLYLFSGGSEETLLTWQLETAKPTFLPRLGAAIDSITVSKSGASFALQMDDNTAILLSTATREPTTYVTGLQTFISGYEPIDPVKRVSSTGKPTADPSPIPLAFNPTQPSRLVVGVGNDQLGSNAMPGHGARALPFIQIYDLSYLSTVSKQALTRTSVMYSKMTTRGYAVIDPEITHLAFSADGKWLASIDQWLPPTRDYKVAHDVEAAVKNHREVHLKFWNAETDNSPDSNKDIMPLDTRIESPHGRNFPVEIFGLAADPSRARFATVGDDCVVKMWTPTISKNNGVEVKDANGETVRAWSCTMLTSLGEPHTESEDNLNGEGATERNGSLCFSRDGSALFVALGTQDGATVHMVDTESGEVRRTMDSLSKGRIRDMQLVHKYLVAVSDELRVYDVVLDQLVYGVALEPYPRGGVQLAVDHDSQRFAISLRTGHGNKAKSELAVFDPRHYSPLLEAEITDKVLGLSSPPGSSAFVVLDSAAQLRIIDNKFSSDSLRLLKPLAELDMDEVEAADGSDDEEALSKEQWWNLVDGKDANGVKGGDEDEDGDVDMEDPPPPSILPQERLSEIFNQAPAWAMPPMEEIFDQITAVVGEYQKKHSED